MGSRGDGRQQTGWLRIAKPIDDQRCQDRDDLLVLLRCGGDDLRGGRQHGSKNGVALSRVWDGVHVEVNGHSSVDVMLMRQPLCASWLYLYAASGIGTAIDSTSLKTVTMASTSPSVRRSSGPPLARAVNGGS
jgi:hypothetical protein